MAILAWTLTVICFLAGLAGLWLPLLPGLPLLALGALLNRLLLPRPVIGWWLVALFVLGALLGYVLEFLATAWTAKKAGAGKAGVRGAIVGGLVGLFFGLPGVLLGPFMGAVGFELIAKRPTKEAFKAGLGAALGLLVSALGKSLLAAGLLFLFVVDAFVL